MSELSWKKGSTKSLVILTDANYLSPDRDGMTFDEVVALSKKIDPVNFYIITNSSHGDYYESLASATDGKVVTNFDELSLLTDYILERYDSLPRVEEDTEIAEKPTLEIKNFTENPDGSFSVSFSTNGSKTLVVLNERVLGVTDEDEITISGLDLTAENSLTLIPLGEDIRGESVVLELSSEGFGSSSDGGIELKAPNTGQK